MFLDIDKRDPNHIAVIDGSEQKMTYGELCSFSNEFYSYIGHRSLVFILCHNCIAPLAAYVSCLSNRVVPLLLSANTDREMVEHLIEVYHPEYIWGETEDLNGFPYEKIYEAYNYSLLKTGLIGFPMYEDLSLLLTTSGSTGSAKFVRHSYENVIANARNVSRVFEMNESSIGMDSLPLQFTQGLNVATSHLLSGAVVLLTKANLMQKEFWDFFKKYRAQSMTCVPYSIELLEKLRFFRMDLPDFQVLNQGGGRLPDKTFMLCADYAEKTGRKFIATYGSTETTSRMAYLPAELASRKCGSIGKALPECSLTLIDDSGNVIDQPNEVGEIIFKGPNVTLGYAESGADLIKGDERHGQYATGDLAYFDEDGCFFIVGRKKRFLKIFGYRISLDETERMLKDHFHIECACVGNDKKMSVFTTAENREEEIIQYLSEKTNLHRMAFEVRFIETIPKNDTGKTQYKELESMI